MDYLSEKIQLEDAEKHIADSLCNGEVITYGHGRYQTQISISDVHEEIEHDNTLYSKYCDLTIAILHGDTDSTDKLKGLYRLAAEKVAYTHANEYLEYVTEQDKLEKQISDIEWRQSVPYFLTEQSS